MHKFWMKALVLCLGLLWVASVGAQVHVRGYYKKNGTYVAPHYRSSPNSSRLDNWSTRGNVNPYTGKAGTRNPYPSDLPQRQGINLMDITRYIQEQGELGRERGRQEAEFKVRMAALAEQQRIERELAAAYRRGLTRQFAKPQATAPATSGAIAIYRCTEADGSYRYAHQPGPGCEYLGSGVVQRGR